MHRRVLLVVSMVVFFWAAPASAQTPGDPVLDYPPTTPGSVSPTTFTSVPPTVTTVPQPEFEEEEEVEAAGVAEGDLAKTGADNILPLIQAAIVLLGAGTLLVLVARRRRAVRRAATA